MKKETPICRACQHMELMGRANRTGGTALGGPRGRCHCGHPDAVATFNKVCPRSPRMAGFIGYTAPRWKRAADQDQPQVVPVAGEGKLMEVTVNMSAEEFREFMEWKELRDLYERRENTLRHDMGARLEGLASAVCKAISPRDDTPEIFEITEQGHMNDAWELAQDVFA